MLAVGLMTDTDNTPATISSRPAARPPTCGITVMPSVLQKGWSAGSGSVR